MSAPLHPSADEARRLLQQELAKAEYQNSKPGLLDRLAQRFWDWVQSLQVGSVHGAPVLATIIVLVIVAIVVLVLFRVYGRPRLNARGSTVSGLFSADDTRTAADLRAAAARAAAAGDAGLALAEAFRALARGLDERAILTTTPGTTAHAFALAAADRFPGQSEALAAASAAFDGVRYLERTVTEADYERVRDLDRTLESTRPAPHPDDLATAAAGAGTGPGARA